MKMRFECWRHVPTGELWAVQLVDDTVVRACGPIFREDVTLLALPSLVYSRIDGRWIDESREDFTPHASPSPRLVTPAHAR
jgi:hypothetical protein